MTLEDLLAELTERGYELSYLRGPDPQWEAYIVAKTDQEHVQAVAHSRQPTPVAAVEMALAKLQIEPKYETFIPNLGAIAPAEAPRDLLRSLGLRKPLGIQRRL